jgi:hypothetical protein
MSAPKTSTRAKQPQSSGYSGTPLAGKLGIKAGSRVALVDAPSGFERLLVPLPADVRFERQPSETTDLAHVFATRRAELALQLQTLRPRLRPDAAVWVSWPKKASRVATDVTEDVIRALALPLGFVDVKVCAVTDVWSGLKLVVRKELRG